MRVYAVIVMYCNRRAIDVIGARGPGRKDATLRSAHAGDGSDSTILLGKRIDW